MYTAKSLSLLGSLPWGDTTSIAFPLCNDTATYTRLEGQTTGVWSCDDPTEFDLQSIASMLDPRFINPVAGVLDAVHCLEALKVQVDRSDLDPSKQLLGIVSKLAKSVPTSAELPVSLELGDMPVTLGPADETIQGKWQGIWSWTISKLHGEKANAVESWLAASVLWGYCIDQGYLPRSQGDMSLYRCDQAMQRIRDYGQKKAAIAKYTVTKKT